MTIRCVSTQLCSLYVYIYMCIYIRVCMNIYIYIQTCIYIYIYICIEVSRRRMALFVIMKNKEIVATAQFLKSQFDGYFCVVT